MFNALDLQKIEKKAYRSIQQDGLYDVYIGGIVMSMSALAYFADTDAFPFVRFGLLLLGLAVSYLVFWAGRKFLTTPRLGQARFGPQRQRRARTLALVLSGLVLLQVLIVAGTVLLWQNPQWAGDLGLASLSIHRERLLVAVIGALFAGPGIAIMAYFNDFTRGYYIAFIVSLAVFSLIWFQQPVYLTVAGLLIILPGIYLFARFLREHPLPPAEIRHD